MANRQRKIFCCIISRGISRMKNSANKEEKKVISIYRINPELEILNKDKKSVWENIQNIIKASKYYQKETELKKDFLINFEKKCFKLFSENSVGWEKYAKEFLAEPLNLKKNPLNGLILLIKSKQESKDIYAIGFGAIAYLTIQNYIDTDFGLDILFRIIEPNSNIVYASKGQNVVGTTQGQLNTYRKLLALSDIENFDYICQELNLKINKDILMMFGIKTEKEFKNCCAKSFFQIRTSIDTKTIEQYILGCEHAKTLERNYIGSVRQLNKRKDKELIKKIKKEIIEKLWTDIQNNSTSELCHADFDLYIKAEKYQYQYRNRTIESHSNKTLHELIKLFKIEEKNFKNFLDSAKITSCSDEKPIETEGPIIKHIVTEYVDEDNGQYKKYFMLNDKIYFLEEKFISYLDNTIKGYKNKKLFISSTLKEWGDENENEYNKLYKNEANTIVIHPYKHKNVELCDILKFDNSTVRLYFIKDGFECNIRDLSNQVYITAKQIENSINQDYQFIKEFYIAFKKAHPESIDITEEEFTNLFKTKKIEYIFAFRDKNNYKLSENPEKFGSNIAKFALIDLVKKMKDMDNNALKIEQIKSKKN